MDATGERQSTLSQALELAGARWNLAIIHELHEGAGRFNALRKALGISGKMLTRRLHLLLAYGIIERRPSATQANVREYRLTQSGHQLYSVVAALGHWAEDHLPRRAGEANGFTVGSRGAN